MDVRIFINCFLLFMFFLSAAGCLPDWSGQDPPSDRLNYPVGMAVTAEDKYLLVANSNFDLKYNSGTLVTISLSELKNVIDVITKGERREWESKDGEFMYVPESELIVPENTIRIATYANDLELTPRQDRALIPIRGGSERHVLIVDIDESSKSGKVLSCGQGDDRNCDRSHRVTSNENVTMPIDPYEVTSLEYTRSMVDGNNQEVILHNTIGFATHPESGAVSVFLIENNQGNLDATLLGVMDNVTGGSSGIAANSTNNEIYVSGRENSDSYVAVMQVLAGGGGGTYTNKPYFGVTDKINLGRDLLGGTDTRGISVSSDGTKAFVVSRSPEALLKFDIGSRRIVDMSTVGTDPSIVGIFRDESDKTEYAFVTCYGSNQLFVINTDNMTSVVRTTGSGPHSIAFDKTRKYAYIANFRESTITVIHATPPFDHVRVGENNAKLIIGIPHLPEGHN